MYILPKIEISPEGNIYIEEKKQKKLINYNDFFKIYQICPQLNKSTTLRSILLMIDKYGLSKINPFSNYYIKKAKNLPKINNSKYKSLIISKTIILFNERMSEETSLLGLIEGREEPYSMTLEKTDEIIDIEIKIGESRLFLGEKQDPKYVTKEFSLFEIVNSIINTIMFSGTDENKQEEVKEIKKRVAEIEKDKTKVLSKEEAMTKIKTNLNINKIN